MKKWMIAPVLAALLCVALGTVRLARAEGPNAIVNDPGCTTNVLPANDDDASPEVALPFAVNFGGVHTSLWVNNNGNVTFTSSLGPGTPSPLLTAGLPIIAPFWADVDTRGVGSDVVRYGLAAFGGHQAFCVNWVNVGSYSFRTTALNSFQLLLVNRSDTGAGNFDIVFNYDKIQWDRGSLPGNSAIAGYSDGATAFQLPGSAVPGAFLDSNPLTGLIHSSFNAPGQLGRYVYPIRNTITQPPAITSGNAATFTTGQAGSFTVTATGTPTPALSASGALPAGVTFVDNHNGTATLAGTPAPGSGGSYPLTIAAANGVPPNATQAFTLTVVQAPAITSGNAATFTTGQAGSFTVTATGTPTPALSASGALPAGVTFVDNHNGTATLAGTPAPGSGGSYPLTIAAANGVPPNATQAFTLTVVQAPAITSGNAALFTEGVAGSFTVTTTGSPTPALSKTGALPAGVTFVDNGNGTATLAGTPAEDTGDTYPLTITAANGVPPNATQAFTLTVAAALTADQKNCDGVYSGYAKNVTVPSGAVCVLLAGTQVKNDVKVKKGGTLIDLGATIGRDLDADHPAGIQIAGGSVGHDLEINDASGAPAGGDYVRNVTVGHDLEVTQNVVAIVVSGNTVGHDLRVEKNRPGGAAISGNHAGHDASCKDNSPQTGGGNTAVHTSSCPA